MSARTANAPAGGGLPGDGKPLRRQLRDLRGALMASACRIATFAVVGVLVLMLTHIVREGAGVVDLEFLTQPPTEGMTQGGIFPAIFGTVAITLLMILMALPLGVLAGIYLVEYAGSGMAARVIRAAVNNLAGVPSIVFGLFGVGFFVLFVGRNLDRALGPDGRAAAEHALGTGGAEAASGLLFGQPMMLWAAATLACLVLPIIIVTTQEALTAVPQSHRDGSLALGATRWQTIRNIVLPQARAGILTGAILSVSRGAGETAPILFTGCAYFLPRLPVTELFGVIPMINPCDQFMNLSYHIFILATQSTDTQVTLPLQYGTALVLVAITFLLNLTGIVSRFVFRRRMSRARS
jgi:phosphate transport system permease protein